MPELHDIQEKMPQPSETNEVEEIGRHGNRVSVLVALILLFVLAATFIFVRVGFDIGSAVLGLFESESVEQVNNERTTSKEKDRDLSKSANYCVHS